MKTILIIFFPIALGLISCSKSDITFSNSGGNANELHNKPVGTSANDLLSSGKYKSLKIEIQYMAGYAPDAGAVTHVQNFLSNILNKPSGISVVTKEIPATSSLTLTLNDIIQIENNNRTAFSSGDQIAVYVLYTNSNYSDDAVLGIAYRNTSMALMGKKIHDNSGGLGQANRTKLEATVMEHELGHLLGLVDLGSTMQTNHKDAAHGNHCNNTDCLMYYSSETTSVLGFLITGNIPSFDGNCLADLQANGGK